MNSKYMQNMAQPVPNNHFAALFHQKSHQSDHKNFDARRAADTTTF